MDQASTRRLLLVMLCSASFGSGCSYEFMSRDTGEPEEMNAAPTGGSSTTGPQEPVEPIPGEWVNKTSDLAGTETVCGALSEIDVKPDDDLLIAGIGARGLWTSDNGGDSWERLGDESEVDLIVNRPRNFIFDPKTPSTFWEVGTYGPGVYKTEDSGKNWTVQGDVHHTDAISVDFTDPERKTMLAGGHEAWNTLHLSTDGGKTWENIGDRLPEGNCTIPFVVSTDEFLVGCSGYGGGFVGILRSTDAGESWEEFPEMGGGGRDPLLASDGVLYWQNVGTGLSRSMDQGATWEVVDRDWVRYQPLELPGGRLASRTDDRIIVSSDQGETWEAASPKFPPLPEGFHPDSRFLVYSQSQKAFFMWYMQCGDLVILADDSVMRFDYE